MTIFVEDDARVLAHQSYPGNQFVLRVDAPRIAASAQPGSFVHLRCDPSLLMRRPLSIMRVCPQQGWVELLYRVVGDGTRLLSQRVVGDSINVMGPIGQPFVAQPDRPRALLIGGGVGIPPMVFLADQLRVAADNYRPFVLMGSETPFPFTPQPSQFIVPGMPEGVMAAMPLMEDWDIASRLASQHSFAGCFQGYVTELAVAWLDAMTATERDEVSVYACGPHPMLAAVARVADRYHLPCQVSLEERMACAVGGCAGCVVPVRSAAGEMSMQRVCVDGPVFDAREVFTDCYGYELGSSCDTGQVG
ncbi:MAG: dihydroorotate dehydrogenase electron transfer subunit [Gammaproteobacteria bacterium]|nr:dihydroorotate dehydrogenase electron transfer subunit [Gammaproteobacteria bacterium]